MSEPKKHTLYVDTTDEITAVISKMQDASSRIVAIVLPKRAPVFQSIINIKLLKKAADKASKKVVLVTSDKTVLPLAGSAGVHVAKTAQSKPYIPDAPSAVQESLGTTATKAGVDPSKSIGELAAASTEDTDDTIDVSEFPKIELDDAAKKDKNKKKKGARVPNFNKFRLMLILGVVAVLLLGFGWYLAAFVLPRADITVETATQSTAQTIEFRSSANQESVDREEFIVPAVTEEYETEESASVSTTGERNDGDRAEGEVTLRNCTSQDGEVTIPSGTEVRSGTYAFLTEDSVTLPPSMFSGGGNCISPQTEAVDVEAREPGAEYNIDEADYQVSGFPEVQAEGSEMSGGTDDIVQIVDERDIRTARQQIEEGTSSEAQLALEELHDLAGRIALSETLTIEDTNATASPQEGAEADEVTVSLRTSYSMLGVSGADIRELLEEHMQEEIDTETQAIVDDGLEDASLRIIAEDDEGVTIRLRTIVAVGPEVDTDALAEDIAGMARSETESVLIAREGVRDVQIDYSPFWVFSTPDNPDKISITIVQQGSEPEEEFEEESEEERAEE